MGAQRGPLQGHDSHPEAGQGRECAGAWREAYRVTSGQKAASQ